ncbi:VCBS repeat-containing protein [Dactylosporangium aurantiacum]|uniref:VCBS repeat-containing protein n=1 Tax=Dactylosporangium aurantiacum TaxID=35754 RepID=A0A9Q9IBA4_9ACTN|nr:VCBS repeat-containing protein [Dactylosporangium aurantiacum]MDG6107221.1 VCBS repeat-containing protein [Dactylosporangium aurantiacum]UWZ51245.1 VCBS repeat-containing protein [Dactylosporangium aurantiacum]
MRTNRLARRIAGSLLGLGLALAGVTVQAAPAAAAPATPQFGPYIEPLAAYDGQDTCDPTAKPGVTAFKNMLNAEYGSHTWGIVRDCGTGGTSEHKEGRALDYHFNYYDSAQRADAQDLINWLLATDSRGNRYANARRLGIMYMIWNNQMWKAYDTPSIWHSYSGESPHTDHIHFSFSWAGARKQTTWWTQRMISRDFDGDGYADLLARNATTKDVHLYRGDGSGFASGTGENIGNNFSAFDQFISVGDFSGDGNADLMVRNASTKNLHLYRGNGSGGFASGTGEQVGTNFSAFDQFIGIGDFSGDGKADLLVRNATTKNLHLYRGDGSGFASGTGEQVGTNFSAFDQFIGVGDFSGDGKPDLIVRNASTKNLHLYRGNGSGGFVSGTGEQIGTNFSAFDMFIGAGDFSNDGKADLIVRNASTKNLHLYRGDGSGFASGTGEQIGTNFSAFDRIV